MALCSWRSWAPTSRPGRTPSWCSTAPAGTRPGTLRWPGNISPLPLPAYSPELNPQERVWEFLRQHYLALRRFLDHTALLEACQDGWRQFISAPGRVRPLCSYPWAAVP
jgi:DDE superfamily endonuclease